MNAEVLAALRAFLRRDHHHAVGATRTVDGGSRSVLQDFDGLDVGSIDVVEVTVNQGKAIDHVERVIARIDRSRTTDTQRRHLAWTQVVEDGKTRRLALQGFERVGGKGRSDGIRTERSGRTRQVRLAHRTVAHHYHVVEQFGILGEGDLHRRSCLDILGGIADERDFERRAGVDLQHKPAAGVGVDAVGRSTFEYTGARNGVTVLIDHRAIDGNLLCRGCRSGSGWVCGIRRGRHCHPNDRQCRSCNQKEFFHRL